MLFLSAFLLCFVLNLNTLEISLFYGKKKIHFMRTTILLVSILTSIGTLFFMHAGKLILILFEPKVGNIFGAISLCFIGVYYIVEYIRLENKYAGYDTSYYYESSLKYTKLIEPTYILNLDKTNIISLKKCFEFSIALILNNFYIFFSAGITGININFSVFLNFVLALFTLYLGYLNCNTNILNFFYKFSNLISGTILIILGLYEAFI
jgi:putative sporulation protein YtaF